MMSLTFGLFTQVSGSGPLGPLVSFFLARFTVVVPVSLVCDSSIVTTCPSIPAARYAFHFCVLFVLFLFVVGLSGEPNRNKGEGWSTAN